MGYHWDFSGLNPYWGAFLRGLGVTAALGVLSSALGTLAGIPLAFALRTTRIISGPLTAFLDAVRAVPNLVLIFFFYYFPYEAVLGVRSPSPFVAVLVALIAAQAAYSADLFRVALDGVPALQVEGLRAMGFSPSQVLRFAVLPSVVRHALPGHVALWIGNLKLSSLASVVGVEDVVFVAKVAMSQSFRSLESWLVVAASYVVIVLPFTYLLRSLESSAWINRK